MEIPVNTVTVRMGEERDLSRVLELIQELAVFEKCPDEVTVTVDEMRKWGFGSEKVFDFFVAEDQRGIQGIALFYYKYSTWKGRCLFLEDLIVTEKERGKGIGTLLFKAVIQRAKADRVRRLEWQVLDWNAPAISFYNKFNANLDGEWLNGRLNEKQIQSL